MILCPEPFPKELLVAHASPSFPSSPQVFNLSAFPLKQAAVSWWCFWCTSSLVLQGGEGAEGITSTIPGSVTFLLAVVILAFCFGVSACTCKALAGWRWQKEAELKRVQMSCWSAHRSKLSSACSFSVNHLILFGLFVFLFCFWVFFSFNVEYRLSTPVLRLQSGSTCESCSFFPMLQRSHPPFYWALYGHKWRGGLSPKDVAVSEFES